MTYVPDWLPCGHNAQWNMYHSVERGDPCPLCELKRLNLKVDEQQKEIDRLKGPFTCKHDAEYIGGACAACHAEWIDKAEKLELQVRDYQSALRKVDKCCNCLAYNSKFKALDRGTPEEKKERSKRCRI